MFDQKSLNTLEYPKILESLAEYAQSVGGKAKAQALVPIADYSAALRALDETAEADRTMFEFSVNPSFTVDDVLETIVKAKKGALLSIPEILKIGRELRISRRVAKAIKSVNGIPILSEMASRLFFEEEIEQRIFDAFISDTEVSDNASAELKSIRQRIRKLNEGVKAKLQSFITAPAYQKCLQDNIITVRSDRYVIPLKSEFKGAIAGLVHDQSESGNTLYVEPMAVVELNNELKTAMLDEKKEIERILRSFSLSIMGVGDSLEWTYQILIDMDVIFAKANLARVWKAVRPELNSNGVLSIVQGRHPLIDSQKVVPVSLKLGKNDRMLLITGPNTGGKTVTLKLVGLFVLLAMSGIYLPAKGADIPVVDGVYSDIGDEQSIEQSLSTFSAHIKNIIGILDKLSDNSLVLFDELGAGTDPGEGAALAVSISEYVMSTGAKALITSHFNDLKEYALIKDGVVAASMEFNAETLSPTFKLVMGAIGSSNALDIAAKLGLDKNIVEAAKSRISPEKRQFDKVLSAAEETRRNAAKLVGEASLDREKAAKELLEVENQKLILQQKREKLDENIRRETKRLIEQSVEEADEIIAKLREIVARPQEDLSESDVFEARKLKRQLQNMSAHYDSESIPEDKPVPGELKIGNNVWVKSLSKKGVLIKRNSREADVSFGKIVIKVKDGDYYKVK